MMNWAHSLKRQNNRPAIQIQRWVWMAFAVFAIGCAIPGIPHYFSILQTPCIGPRCLDFQLTPETGQAWVALGVKLASYAAAKLAFLLIIVFLLISTAAFLIWRSVDNRASVVAAFVGVAAAASSLTQVQARVDPRFWFPAQLVLFVQMAGLLPLFCLLPDGRFQPSWLRWVSVAYILANTIYFFPGYSSWIASGTPGNILWTLFLVISLLVVITTLFYRFRRSKNNVQQGQILWVLAGISLAVLYILSGNLFRSFDFHFDPLAVFNIGPATEFVNMFLAVGSFTCLLVALVNYEPLDLKIIIHRTLVYLALTAFIIAAYGLIVGYLSTAFHSANVLFSLIATGLIAIVFQPVRDWFQRAVNRLIYGARDEPYQVLARLSRQVENAVDPSATLPLIVSAVAGALKLPYVAILLRQGETSRVIAEHGTPVGRVASFPLVYTGAAIGELVVAERGPGEAFNQADERLLNDIARQISAAVHAAQLSIDLQQARLRIVEAREETRRRLGSDLHDGVGHRLASLIRKTERVQNVLGEGSNPAADALTEITQDLNATMLQVRSLAHQLHPPELELLGLAGALREQAGMHPNLTIRINAFDRLPALSTAVETAAYYIVLEALTNIEKHAAAHVCTIQLTLSNGESLGQPPFLIMEILDDGKGLAVDRIDGLGLLSMQGRAVEVGGTCQISANPAGGTCISVCLPVRSSEEEA